MDLVFNPFSYTLPLNGEFNPFTFRVIIDMEGFTNTILFICFLAILQFIPHPLCFCLPFKIGYFSDVLCFPFDCLSWVYSRFLLCGYHETSIKHLIDNSSFLTLSNLPLIACKDCNLLHFILSFTLLMS